MPSVFGAQQEPEKPQPKPDEEYEPNEQPRRSDRLKDQENLAVYREENLGVTLNQIVVKDEYEQIPDPLLQEVHVPLGDEAPNFEQGSPDRQIKTEKPSSPIMHPEVPPDIPNLQDEDIEIGIQRPASEPIDPEPERVEPVQPVQPNVEALQPLVQPQPPHPQTVFRPPEPEYSDSYHSYVFPIFLGLIVMTYVSQMKD